MAIKRRVPKFRRATPSSAPRGARRSDARVSEKVWPSGRLGTPHQCGGRSVHRVDQSSFSEQVRPGGGDLRDAGALVAGIDPRASGQQSGFAARSVERIFPRFLHSRTPGSTAVQRVVGVLEHGGACARDPRCARPHLRQISGNTRVFARSAGGHRGGAAIQSALRGDRFVRPARWALGRAELVRRRHSSRAKPSHCARTGSTRCATAPFRGSWSTEKDSPMADAPRRDVGDHRRRTQWTCVRGVPCGGGPQSDGARAARRRGRRGGDRGVPSGISQLGGRLYGIAPQSESHPGSGSRGGTVCV